MERKLLYDPEYEEYDYEESVFESCPKCGRLYDDIGFDYQYCKACGWDAEKKQIVETWFYSGNGHSVSRYTIRSPSVMEGTLTGRESTGDDIVAKIELLKTPHEFTWTATERIEEAKATGSDAIVTCCGWCERNFMDAVANNGDKMDVYDIIELVQRAM